MKFRLERSRVSFAYPPIPLEAGVRFHGRNFFRFPAEKYFPEGYPYFGLKFSFRTSLASSLLYFAASSFAQSELELVQMYASKPWFLANTQFLQTNCLITLGANTSGTTSFADNKWHDTKVLRLTDFAYLSADNFPNKVRKNEFRLVF